MGTQDNMPGFIPGQRSDFTRTILKQLRLITKYWNSKIDTFYSRFYNGFSQDASVMIDVDGTILNWNQNFEKMYGYKEPEILGQSWSLLYPPHDRNIRLHEKLMNIAETNGSVTYLGKWSRKDGTPFLGKMIIKAIKGMNNEVIGFIENLKELSEVKIKKPGKI
jgi:PAS domain S-box-containing protein